MTNNDKLDSPAGKWTDEAWAAVAAELGKIRTETAQDRRNRKILEEIQAELEQHKAEYHQIIAIPDLAPRLESLRRFQDKLKAWWKDRNFMVQFVLGVHRRSKARRVVGKLEELVDEMFRSDK